VPLYEYECEKCHRRTEKIESMKGPHLKKCPHCGGKVERLLSSPAIQFKGTGWYVTDYAGKKSSATEGSSGAPASESASKDASSKDSGSKETSKESGTKEKKTGKKKD
jgi:putative FmdB family regulatory protein